MLFLLAPLGRPLLAWGGVSWELSLANGDSNALASCGDAAVPPVATSVVSAGAAAIHKLGCKDEDGMLCLCLCLHNIYKRSLSRDTIAI